MKMYDIVEKLVVEEGGGWDSVLREIEKKGIWHVKVKEKGVMDFVVEIWKEGKMLKVSLAHYGKLNGDLMRDPEVVCRVEMDERRLIPLYYRNDYVGVEYYLTSEERRNEVEQFLNVWAESLRFLFGW